MPTTPATPLSRILNRSLAGRFRTARGIETVGDLLDFWPRRYRTREADLGNLHDKEYLVSVAQVVTVQTRPMRRRRGQLLTATLSDGRNQIVATFFDARGHEDKLVPGARAIFAGTVAKREWRGKEYWQLTHPGYTMLDAYDSGDTGDGPIPVYLRVGSLHTWTVSRCVRQVIDSIEDLPDPIPPDILDRRGLLTRVAALRAIHTPADFAQTRAGRRRMAYEEALVLQIVLARRRAQHARERATARMPRPGGLLDAFDARLPFALTTGQRAVGEAIAGDLAGETPMHRLLQGEVGSGKTLVALRAMLAVVDAGGQAALLAPTEVLAHQHHRSIAALLGGLGEEGMLGAAEHATRIALLTGSQAAATRREQLLDIASGRAGIVVGTHALLQDAVSFAELALVVVDEQHRFGVEQRDMLRAKGTAPHVLVMTATPIPRTVAMTVFGDLETSTLREVPAGRAEVTTHVVPEWKPWFPRTWERVGEEVRLGRQAYVVCPRIGGGGEEADERDGADLLAAPEEDDPQGWDDDVGEPGEAPEQAEAGEAMPAPGARTADSARTWSDARTSRSDGADPDPSAAARAQRPMHGVLDVLAMLENTPSLAGLRIAALHGRMSGEDKESTMRAFGAGEIDVLVSTTVIEVGLDVPNASVIVILDADRFGVSQLHQLRGRVGRGGLPGLCLLVSGAESATVGERLEEVARTNDGFELARLDLGQRREGDILGAAQHGRRSQLRFLHVLDDEALIVAARADATALVAEDPDLEAHPGLATAVAEWVDADQAAWLERG